MIMDKFVGPANFISSEKIESTKSAIVLPVRSSFYNGATIGQEVCFVNWRPHAA